MKKLVIIIFFAFLAAFVQALPPKCSGKPCEGGCCPELDYLCCKDGHYCAATTVDCPGNEKVQIAGLLKLVVNKADCDPGMTACHGGCCNMKNAFCCPDELYCADDSSKCPPIAIKLALTP
jgi:hypothetical protein